jgi:alkylation response protein AidB-like acyl-CoA dehydrogenase
MSAPPVIPGDAEALAVAGELAADFRKGAAERDALRRLPHPELERLSASGLLGVTVPAEFGGADVRAETLAEIFRLLAAADASLAQIPQSHFVYVNVLRRQGTNEQQRFLFGEVLRGKRFGNAQSEAGTEHVQDIRTRLARRPDGSYLLDGVKHYCTGALFAHWIPVLARADDGDPHVAFVPRDAPGLTVVDDWDGMGPSPSCCTPPSTPGSPPGRWARRWSSSVPRAAPGSRASRRDTGPRPTTRCSSSGSAN